MWGWCFEPSDAPPVKTSQEMKLLTAIAPALFLVGLIRCSNYLSERQAMDACLEWKADEVIIDYGKPSYSGYQRKVYSRACEREAMTNQVLGLMNKTMERGEWKEGLKEGKKEEVKNFRYNF